MVLVSASQAVPAAVAAPMGFAAAPSRAAASEAQALAQEAVQLKAQAQNFKARAAQLGPAQPGMCARKGASLTCCVAWLRRRMRTSCMSTASIRSRIRSWCRRWCRRRASRPKRRAWRRRPRRRTCRHARRCDGARPVASCCALGSSGMGRFWVAWRSQANMLSCTKPALRDARVPVQAQAVVHAQAQAEATAQAQQLAAKAHEHAAAQRHAAAQADHLKKVGVCDVEDPTHQVVSHAQQLEARAQGHAQAQTQLTVQAHNLAAKAQAHANAQARTSLHDGGQPACKRLVEASMCRVCMRCADLHVTVDLILRPRARGVTGKHAE